VRVRGGGLLGEQHKRHTLLAHVEASSSESVDDGCVPDAQLERVAREKLLKGGARDQPWRAVERMEQQRRLAFACSVA
jgi:hypothetical protein